MDYALGNNISVSQKITGFLEQKPVILQLLRFGCIGVVNTALDFVVLNLMISFFAVSTGSHLGWVNIPGFILAVSQSYIWNRFWTFSEQKNTLFENTLRLFIVGVLGFVTFLLAVLGSRFFAKPWYFVLVFFVFALLQVFIWAWLGFFKNVVQPVVEHHSKLWIFLAVSIVGLAINSGLLVGITSYVQLSSNLAFNANLAKILATLASLVWNFLGYKLLVFRK